MSDDTVDTEISFKKICDLFRIFNRLDGDWFASVFHFSRVTMMGGVGGDDDDDGATSRFILL